MSYSYYYTLPAVSRPVSVSTMGTEGTAGASSKSSDNTLACCVLVVESGSEDSRIERLSEVVDSAWADKGDLAGDECLAIVAMLILREIAWLPAGLRRDLGVPVLDKPN